MTSLRYRRKAWQNATTGSQVQANSKMIALLDSVELWEATSVISGAQRRSNGRRHYRLAREERTSSIQRDKELLRRVSRELLIIP
mmetsp:Transcript_30504/g.116764  ORF Transcript_30504/g.116764 Transcript_30504/m.116764 type:complete len:85 (-) Transcript_30504:598-852(-)